MSAVDTLKAAGPWRPFGGDMWVRFDARDRREIAAEIYVFGPIRGLFFVGGPRHTDGSEAYPTLVEAQAACDACSRAAGWLLVDEATS